LARQLPEYDLFEVAGGEGASGEGRSGEPGADGATPGGAPVPDAPAGPEDATDAGTGKEPQADPGVEAQPALYPPGPLAAVRVRPGHARIAPAGTRTFRAVAEDADGRPLAEGAGVAYAWRLDGPGTLEARDDRADYRAPDDDADALLAVTATEGEREASAEARIRVEDLAAAALGGIPEPEAVHAPSEPWRSRMRGAKWEYNAGHRDYRTVADTEAKRLRYLTHLFAKELVLRNFGHPSDDAVLERLVGNLARAASSRTDARSGSSSQ
jgi:hypothetical protein